VGRVVVVVAPCILTIRTNTTPAPSSLPFFHAEMTEDLPGREILQRWRGEPVRALIFPTSIFLTNKKGYPVLSKARRTVLCAF
jgi:hypothetical protein